MTIERWGIVRGEGRPHISLALAWGDWMTACTTARDYSADLPGQAREILARLDGFLADAGTDRSKLLTATIWLKDISRRAEFDAVWNDWVDRSNPPVRACVQADMARPDALIEIKITAAR